MKLIKAVNTIYNEDCKKTMQRLKENSVDLVITSPPYNNSRVLNNTRSLSKHEGRYKDYKDNMTNEDYIKWIEEIFHLYDKIIKPNGVVLFNLSYGSENPSLMFLLISHLIQHTNFMVADVITWKKSNALPNNTSPNKMTRICELVFVFCRKNEYATFTSNKKVTKQREDNGQKYYSTIFNFVEAKNNDEVCKLNKATFSSEMVLKCLEMYLPKNPNSIVYDSFMGTGTTAVACIKYGCNYLGSEISKEQCEYAKERIKKVREVY